MSGESGWDAVLFDLDGTLADTIELILRSYRHTMRRHLGRELPDDAWLATLGRPLRDQLTAFARTPDQAGAMLETYAAYQRAIHDEMARPYPEAARVVGELKRRGSAVAIVTSKRSAIASRTLDCCGLAGHFDVRVCADHVTNGKPHPEPVLLALATLGLNRPGRVLFVGDSPFDILSGREGGVRTVAALWGPHPRDALLEVSPDYLAESMSDLLTIQP